MTVRAVIIAAGGANYGSLREACRRVGVAAEVSHDPACIMAATHVILPGVGAAAQAMRTLRERGLDRVLAALTQPLLGICLGMQLLFEHSEETAPAGPDAPDLGRSVIPAKAGLHPDSRVACLGLLAGSVRRLPAAPRWPHMGWNTLGPHAPAHPLLDGIDADDWFYFVHGYAAPADAQTIARAEHGGAFAAVVAQRNIHGVQFHPEKSSACGRRLLRNFFGLR